MRPGREHFRHPIQDQSELVLRDASDQNAVGVRLILAGTFTVLAIAGKSDQSRQLGFTIASCLLIDDRVACATAGRIVVGGGPVEVQREAVSSLEPVSRITEREVDRAFEHPELLMYDPPASGALKRDAGACRSGLDQRIRPLPKTRTAARNMNSVNAAFRKYVGLPRISHSVGT